MTGHVATHHERGRGTRPLFFFPARPRALAPLLLAAVVFFGAGPSRAEGLAVQDLLDRLPPPKNVAEARATLLGLGEEARRIDAWIETHWEKEFEARYPELSAAPPGKAEPSRHAGERSMQARVAIAELKESLRRERRAWIDRERRAVLERTFREDLPVRLGGYDAERGEFPLLLGYGWPTALSIRFHVGGETAAEAFRSRFPKTLPAAIRIDEKGELFLESLARDAVGADPVVAVAPAAARLLWEATHESWVTAVASRPDGATLISAGADGAIYGWDAETGTPLLALRDVEMAMGLAVSPDGARFATGGADSRLRLRDGAVGKEIWSAAAPGMIFSASFSPDGRFLATGDDGGALRVWEAETGKLFLSEDLASPVRSVAFSPGGRLIAAGIEGNAFLLFDMAARRQVWRRQTEGSVYAVAVGGRDGLVAAGGGDGKVTVVREADGSEAWSRKTDGEVRAIRFDGAGRLLAVGAGYVGRVHLAETGDPLWSTSVGSPVRSLALGPGGRKLAIGSADFRLRVFEIDEGNRVLAAYSSLGLIYVDGDKARALFR